MKNNWKYSTWSACIFNAFAYIWTMKTTQEDIIKTLQEQVLFLEENLAEKDKVITKKETEITTSQQVVSEQKATIENLEFQYGKIKAKKAG